MNVAAASFTPFASLAGGLSIGLAATLYMALFGRIAGVSAILARLLAPAWSPASLERLGFVVGLLGGPLLATAATGRTVEATLAGPASLFAFAGVLVGVGVTLANGCTSGHGVCGLARLSKRSLAATATFMAVALAVVFVRRHLWGA